MFPFRSSAPTHPPSPPPSHPRPQLSEKQEEALALRDALAASGSAPFTVASTGKTHTLTKDMVAISVERKRISVRPFVPNVIEPSFGIGRIITGVLEHNFTVRHGDDARGECMN